MIGFAAYFLWTGKANCWPGQSTNKTSPWWILREEQPFAYWFRVVLSTAIGLMLYAGGSLLFLGKHHH